MFLCVFAVVGEAREIPQSRKTARAHRVRGERCKSICRCYPRQRCGELRSLLTAALCKCLVTSSCLLTVQGFFGTLRSYFCHLKKGMGSQGREYHAAEPSRSRQSNGIWFQPEWSAWKSSTSELPLCTDLQNLFRSDGPKWHQIPANIQI